MPLTPVWFEYNLTLISVHLEQSTNSLFKITSPGITFFGCKQFLFLSFKLHLHFTKYRSRSLSLSLSLTFTLSLSFCPFHKYLSLSLSLSLSNYLSLSLSLALVYLHIVHPLHSLSHIFLFLTLSLFLRDVSGVFRTFFDVFETTQKSLKRRFKRRRRRRRRWRHLQSLSSIRFLKKFGTFTRWLFFKVGPFCSATRLGFFWKVLVTNFLSEVSQISDDILGYFAKCD